MMPFIEDEYKIIGKRKYNNIFIQTLIKNPSATQVPRFPDFIQANFNSSA
jgi:hypothetical protein